MEILALSILAATMRTFHAEYVALEIIHAWSNAELSKIYMETMFFRF